VSHLATRDAAAVPAANKMARFAEGVLICFGRERVHGDSGLISELIVPFDADRKLLSVGQFEIWLGGRDSNPDNVVQRTAHRLSWARCGAFPGRFARDHFRPLPSVSVCSRATCLIVSQLLLVRGEILSVLVFGFVEFERAANGKHGRPYRRHTRPQVARTRGLRPKPRRNYVKSRRASRRCSAASSRRSPGECRQAMGSPLSAFLHLTTTHAMCRPVE
jgi:hypothetical protein